jgi:hypothetical protein
MCAKMAKPRNHLCVFSQNNRPKNLDPLRLRHQISNRQQGGPQPRPLKGVDDGKGSLRHYRAFFHSNKASDADSRKARLEPITVFWQHGTQNYGRAVSQPNGKLNSFCVGSRRISGECPDRSRYWSCGSTRNEMTVRTVVTASGRIRFTGIGYQPEGGDPGSGQRAFERPTPRGVAPCIGHSSLHAVRQRHIFDLNRGDFDAPRFCLPVDDFP